MKINLKDSNRKSSAAVFITAAVFSLALLAHGCGGGGNQIPTPRNMARDCSKIKPAISQSLQRLAQQTYGTYWYDEGQTSIQCLQLMWTGDMEDPNWQANYYNTMTIQDVFPRQITVGASHTVYFWAGLYNPDCYLVSPDSNFTWEVDSKLGSVVKIWTYEEYFQVEGVQYKYPYELIEFATVNASTQTSGTMTVSYKGHTDSLTMTVKPN